MSHGVNRSVSENSSLAEAVNQCVKFLICSEGSKLPIKNADIENHITTTHPAVDKKLVIENANRILKSVYGYKLVKLKNKGVCYIMVLNSKLPSSCETLPSPYAEPNHRKILIAALTHIFMAGGTVREPEMWDFLNRTKLLNEHDVQSRKILTKTFKSQLYLEYNKNGPDEKPWFEFCWGQRAHEEIPKEFILNKMAQAFGKETNYWMSQYRSIQENENAVQ